MRRARGSRRTATRSGAGPGPWLAVVLPALLGALACPSPAPEAAVEPASPPIEAPPLARGLRVTIGPNLPGVHEDDVSARTRRVVEVVACDGRTLKLRWAGRVLVEAPESARRREAWLRERGRSPLGSSPPPVATATWEERAVGGTLTFPDFGTSRNLLLPGLWPEGNATLRDATAIWLPAKARDDLKRAGAAWIPFLSEGPSLTGPAAELLSRASTLHVEPPGGDTAATPSDVWRLEQRDVRYPVRLGGARAELSAVRAASWLGRYEVLADDANPLVLSVMPEPPSSQLMDLFSPARVLKSLLGYRVLEVEAGAAVLARESVPARGTVPARESVPARERSR